ncbi:hypothetical protein KC323_g16 [Hortaea werneckii]|nr:hypothetical protein KC323_g16 [Hortaea werneckii]
MVNTFSDVTLTALSSHYGYEARFIDGNGGIRHPWERSQPLFALMVPADAICQGLIPIAQSANCLALIHAALPVGGRLRSSADLHGWSVPLPTNCTDYSNTYYVIDHDYIGNSWGVPRQLHRAQACTSSACRRIVITDSAAGSSKIYARPGGDTHRRTEWDDCYRRPSFRSCGACRGRFTFRPSRPEATPALVSMHLKQSRP